MTFNFKKLVNKNALFSAGNKVVEHLDETSKTIRSTAAKIAGDKLNEITGDELASQKVNEKYRAVEKFSQEVTDKAVNKIDIITEKTASKVTDVTGRETTPEEVKKAAMLATLVISATGSMDAVAGGEGTSTGDLSSPEAQTNDAIPSDSSTVSAGEQSGSFEEETNKFFADKGGLNISTDVVDADGCILDSGA